ncbi:CMGC/MAPK protein kinase [Saprolegnia parasitica CBS 223.65]|uniref:non-specific serine/threonine protein kinase n=1 Tax=Saprolegnia parasitica (strain CBS 223.65) TaxID=695850 RepID=A0A067C1B4_SAPPC|nr:CMGC/MAPK protein kinase [Saprolegnia parasitica CBS 223.65]KDO20346.1 CMGC/MAPK protein kinase [Saprolegnia parasitica CBS 223.65]|eukprot:XP_012208941.1 CMGC/MAPK protein kinase [Saprolegnia parasitica CBS 223.65]
MNYHPQGAAPPPMAHGPPRTMMQGNAPQGVAVMNGTVRKLLRQTMGDQIEYVTSIPQVRSFVAAVDSFCQTTESLASLGKSLYASGSVVFVVDKSMRVILWNDTAVALTGFTRDEVAGRNFLDLPGLVPVSSSSMLEQALFSFMDGANGSRAPLEVSLFAKAGHELRLLCECTPLVGNPAGPGMLVVAQDLAMYDNVKTQREMAALAETPALHAMPSAAQQAAPPTNPIVARNPNPGRGTSALTGWDEIAPHYQIETVLGQGSYGQVVRCKHLPTGDVVAIKKIQNVFSDPIDAKRILRELCILRQLKHRNIVQIREILCPADLTSFQNLYVVFEFLPSDLEKLLHSPQFLTAEHIRWLLLDLLKALKYMHSASIVHRDLKPANVLLNLSPVAIKICDFGLARTIANPTSIPSTSSSKRKRDASPTGAAAKKKIQRQLTEHVVTRWYRAPEIIFRDHDYSTGIDVWSVGCIFAELLSMQKTSVPSHFNREPLFPGVSCFPLSPGASQMALPQDSRDQLNTILRVLGSMADDDIAEVADPDVRFYLRSLPPQAPKRFSELYPGAEPEAIDLLHQMLHMNPRKRASVEDALNHPYLASIRSIEEEDVVASYGIELEFDLRPGTLSIADIRKLMAAEIGYYHPQKQQPNTRARH